MDDGTSSDLGTVTFKAKKPMKPKDNVDTNVTAVKEGYVAIRTAEDLDKVREDLDGYYVLANDIDLASFNGGKWVPIAAATP